MLLTSVFDTIKIFKIGDRVEMIPHFGERRYYEATIEWIGKTPFTGEEIYYGVISEDCNCIPNSFFRNDDITQKSDIYEKMLRETRDLDYLARLSEIMPKPIHNGIKVVHQHPIHKSSTNLAPLSVGDRVLTAFGKIGSIAFFGSVHYDERDMYGIVLDEWPNGHSGVVHGCKYFDSENGKGYFTTHESLTLIE